MTSLSDCLSNKPYWPIDSVNLRKNLLSYETDKGWKVVQRRRLSFGKPPASTDLDWVYKNLRTLKVTPETEAAHLHIQACWHKKHPIICLGNAPPDKADVVIFSQDLTDAEFRDETSPKLVEHLAKKGDVVLVDGMTESEPPKTTSKLTIQGWAPDTYAVPFNEFTKTAQTHLQELQACMTEFEKDFSWEGPLTEEEKPVLVQKLQQLSHKIDELNKYYKSDSASLALPDTGLILLNHKLMSKKTFLGAIQEMIKTIGRHFYAALHRNLTPEEQQAKLQAAAIRNKALASAIDKHVQERKVFVFTGADNVLKHPVLNPTDSSLLEALKKHTFCVITRSDQSGSLVASDNLDLQVFPMEKLLSEVFPPKRARL